MVNEGRKGLEGVSDGGKDWREGKWGEGLKGGSVGGKDWREGK